MGEKDNPWCHWPNPAWQFNVHSSLSSIRPTDLGSENRISAFLPACIDNHGYNCSGIAAPTPFFAGPLADSSFLKASRFVTTLSPNAGLPRDDLAQKQFLFFNRSDNQTCTMLDTPFLSKGALDPVPELQGSNETTVADVGAHNSEEIHENTEEIDALLDSDSDEGYEKAHEFALAAKTPVDNGTWSVESVASTGAAQPAKKRRLSSDTDISVVDTASSAKADHCTEQKNLSNDDDAQSCCIGEVGGDHKLAGREGQEAEGDGLNDWQRRRERIQETVAALRKIVPGSIGKDATAVLDEAICYLTYMKLKVKSLGAISL